jgi:uncharacterized membrane protein YgcG
MSKSFLVLLSLILSVSEIPNPRNNNGWISDVAGMLSSEAENAIEQTLDNLERDLGVEIAVVTVENISLSPKEFATKLFNSWGVGKATTNNGVLLLLVRDQQRQEIEIGLGLEDVLSAPWLSEMQETIMTPRFKEGDFDGGIEAGISAIDARIRQAKTLSAQPPTGPSSDTSNVVAPSVLQTSALFYFFVFVGVAALLIFLVSYATFSPPKTGRTTKHQHLPVKKEPSEKTTNPAAPTHNTQPPQLAKKMTPDDTTKPVSLTQKNHHTSLATMPAIRGPAPSSGTPANTKPTAPSFGGGQSRGKGTGASWSAPAKAKVKKR